MMEGDKPSTAPDWADTIVVKCPECGHEFETHDLGDLVGCEGCGGSFERFRNIVADPAPEAEGSVDE